MVKGCLPSHCAGRPGHGCVLFHGVWKDVRMVRPKCIHNFHIGRLCVCHSMDFDGNLHSSRASDIISFLVLGPHLHKAINLLICSEDNSGTIE